MTVDVKFNKYCVYQHTHKGVVVYVGKGISSRPYDTSCRSKQWKDFFCDKESFTVEIVKWCKSEAEAQELELKIVKKLQPCCNIISKSERSEATLLARTKRRSRKDQITSVSFRENDMPNLDAFLERLWRRTGFTISRNEFIRRSSLSTALALTPGNKRSFEEIFKSID